MMPGSMGGSNGGVEFQKGWVIGTGCTRCGLLLAWGGILKVDTDPLTACVEGHTEAVLIDCIEVEELLLPLLPLPCPDIYWSSASGG